MSTAFKLPSGFVASNGKILLRMEIFVGRIQADWLNTNSDAVTLQALKVTYVFRIITSILVDIILTIDRKLKGFKHNLLLNNIF